MAKKIAPLTICLFTRLPNPKTKYEILVRTSPSLKTCEMLASLGLSYNDSFFFLKSPSPRKNLLFP